MSTIKREVGNLLTERTQLGSRKNMAVVGNMELILQTDFRQKVPPLLKTFLLYT